MMRLLPDAIGQLALAIFGFFLTLSMLSWVTIDHLKYVVRASWRAQDAVVALNVVDMALLLAAAGIGIVAVVAGFRNRAAVRLCQGERPLWLFVATAGVLVWMGHAVLSPGLLVTGDAGTHVARVSHLTAAIRGGDSLYWDNYFFGGSTLLQFTGPMFHWLAALANLILGDATEAIKLSVTVARGLAALFAYLLVRQLGAERPASCLAALFYGGSLQLTYMEIVRSSFPQLVNFAAMPAILFCIERHWRRPLLLGPPTAGLALAAICLIGSHQPTAMLFAGYAAVFVVARLAMDPRRVASLPGLGVAAVLAGLGSVFFLVPFALERGMTADNFSTGSLVSIAVPTAEQMLGFARWGYQGQGAEYATYLGLPLLACVAAGGILLLARRDAIITERHRIWLLFAGLAVLSLFLRGAYVRQITFTLLFLSVAGGLGADMLCRVATRWAALPLCLFVAFVLDAAPLALQPWTRSDMGAIVAASDSLARRAADSRVMEVRYAAGPPDVSVGPDSSPLSYARVQMLSGPHKQDATPAHNASSAVLKVAAAELKSTGTLRPSTRGLLALSNIGWVVGTGPTTPGLPVAYADTLSDPELGAYWRIREATPFVVSGRLEQADRPASFDVSPFWNLSFELSLPEAIEALDAVQRFYAGMGADPAARQAKKLLLPVIPDGEEWQAASGETPVAHAIDYRVEPGRVILTLDVDRPGFVRLVHPMAATVLVSRDGRPIRAAADVESLIVLPVHRGINAIVVEAQPSTLRRACFWLTMATALGLLGVLAVGGWPGLGQRKQGV